MQRDLTDRFLKTLEPPESGLIEISDTKRRGLRYRLSETGRGTFIYEKRIKGGKKRKHALGTYPATGLSEAREMALELEAEAAKGIDRVAIAEAKRLEDEAAKAKLVTIQEVIDTYHELHLSDLRTGDERKRQLVQALDRHLNTSITELTRKDLQAAIDDKAKTGRVIMANRVQAALSAFSKWAWQRGYLDDDIGNGLTKAGKEKPREKVLSLDEVRAIYQATFKLSAPWGPMFRLIILTGQRRGEIITLEQNEIDLEKRRIVKPGSKTKNGKPHVTHLCAPALAELQSITRSESEFVFTTTGVTPVSGISKAKRYLDESLGEDFGHWRIHDLRTAMATALAESGEPENIVDRILNHSASGSAPSAVARVYNQADNLPQRARALDKWAAMVTGEESTVVELNYG